MDTQRREDLVRFYSSLDRLDDKSWCPKARRLFGPNDLAQARRLPCATGGNVACYFYDPDYINVEFGRDGRYELARAKRR